MGARKVAVFGVGELGCIPGVKEKYEKSNASLTSSSSSPTLSCVDSVNAAVEKFNHHLKPLILRLNRNLPGAATKFIYINMTSISGGDPSTLGMSSKLFIIPRSFIIARINRIIF